MVEWDDRAVGCWECADAQVRCFYIHVSSCGLDSVYQIDVPVGNKMITLEKVSNLHVNFKMAKKRATNAAGFWKRLNIGEFSVERLLALCEQLSDQRELIPDMYWVKQAGGSYGILWQFGWVRAIFQAFWDQADWWDKRGRHEPKERLEQLLKMLQ